MIPDIENAVDRVKGHDLMDEAELADLLRSIEAENVREIERIGLYWSGKIALDIFDLADVVARGPVS